MKTNEMKLIEKKYEDMISNVSFTYKKPIGNRKIWANGECNLGYYSMYYYEYVGNKTSHNFYMYINNKFYGRFSIPNFGNYSWDFGIDGMFKKLKLTEKYIGGKEWKDLKDNIPGKKKERI